MNEPLTSGITSATSNQSTPRSGIVPLLLLKLFKDGTMSIDFTKPIFANLHSGCKLVKKVIRQDGDVFVAQFYTGLTDAIGSIPLIGFVDVGCIHKGALSNEFTPEPECVRSGC